MEVKNICIDDFDYPLKEENIAKFPLKERDRAKLLVYDGKEIKDEIFSSLPDLLDKDSLLIFNDTKVVYARLFFFKETGAKIEIFCLEPVCPNDIQLAFSQKKEVSFRCLIGNNKKWKQGNLSSTKQHNNQTITLCAEKIEQENEYWTVRFSWNTEQSFAEILDLFGVVPLPPYLNREACEEDKQDYQTVYAIYEGSVAAPTAGLHFSDKTFEDLKNKEIKSCFVTLHVGAGTFKPVSSQTIGEHVMHTEKITIGKEVVQTVLENIDKPIVCVGTTSVRTIESLYWYGRRLFLDNCAYSEIDVKQWEPYEGGANVGVKDSLRAILKTMEKEGIDCIFGQTQLMVAPSYKYRIVKGMVTNFHQPKSTLLLLVKALIGDDWKEVYKHALTNDYRFLSYGDACLFLK
ncbi:MAG: S-adenosylmethionine:tRNA ribosyltransferase-isomerase [Bacteroidales bacterium]|nr:S-adenosylmethionine:tRNA ribosyltransferase-isomerase [Bacteroidales bacterium]